MKPFKIKFEKLDYFTHGKSNHTLWLKPETIPNNALMILEDRLIEKLKDVGFPEFDDLIKIGNEGFKPHLSLGQFRGEVSNFFFNVRISTRVFHYEMSSKYCNTTMITNY